MGPNTTTTAGAAILPRLGALGVDYVFTNAGTDFPPIIEGLVRAHQMGELDTLPKAVVIPHEHAAMGMAHGYYLMTGRPQAVILHNNVGLSNGATGAINAASGNVPVLLMSGRAPVTERGRFGARTVPVGWGQEMHDQAAMVREVCKWDYELRYPEQVSVVLDRAHAIATSTPKGPVYISLPRETLCESVPDKIVSKLDAPATIALTTTAPDPAQLKMAAAMMSQASSPLIIAQNGVGDATSFARFSAWVDEWGIAVSSWWATHLPLPTTHPSYAGSNPTEALLEADVILVLDSIAPWWPDQHELKKNVLIINMGPDPLFQRMPMRGFPSHLSLSGDTGLCISALIDEMERLPRDNGMISTRRKQLKSQSDRRRAKDSDAASERNETGITKEWLSHCLGIVLRDHHSTVFSELGLVLDFIERQDHNSWFQEPHSGGLGWSIPAALGAKLAEPDRLCAAVLGDGSYMFANPTVCHQIAQAMDTPLLIVIANNEEWGAVKRAVKGLYPEGEAVMHNEMPLTSLKPAPDYRVSATASGGWSKRVEAPTLLADALREAIGIVENERRTAVLDVGILPY